jgi:hypothetical protein
MQGLDLQKNCPFRHCYDVDPRSRPPASAQDPVPGRVCDIKKCSAPPVEFARPTNLMSELESLRLRGPPAAAGGSRGLGTWLLS